MSVQSTAAFATAEAITRDQARNFYYGIRLLPRTKRGALCAIYALARRIDDIGDGELPASEKLRQLDELAGQLPALGRTTFTDPVLFAVSEVASQIPVTAFGELVEGVRLDVTGHDYADFDDLVRYCRFVAGSIGRLCLSVFGDHGDPAARGYADALGIALQQTNILRDIREDLLIGRVYLPQSDLDRFGVSLRLDDTSRLVDEDGRLSALIRFSAQRAATWYAEGERLLPLLDRRSRSCCAAMAGIYRHLLDRIAEDPSRVFDRRLSLSGAEKGRIAVRSLLGRSG